MTELKTCECGNPTYSNKCSLCYADEAVKTPQRTWVGLTDEQWQGIADVLGCLIFRDQKDAIETILKENT